MEVALEFALNRPTGEDDSYQDGEAEVPEMEDAASGLNSSQRLHLLSSAQHADKLLAEVESILSAAKSKSAFRRYRNSLPPAQVKAVEDYLACIRTQMVRVLESQGIALPEPAFESIASIRVTLGFARIAFQECTADRMRGYGEVPEAKIRELNGLVDEMVSAIEKLDSYLGQGLGQDLEARLERLGRAGSDIGVARKLERVIRDHGMVEFRGTLSMILDRMESKGFEIALFGRVSSGKSSLLNHIVQADILPVGVNPITAVPTRLVYGQESRLTAWYAHRGPEHTDITRLPDFVSEQHNPGNYRHVTRIVVELPSSRLRDGVTLVDTPGLGSLATSGAAETLAYLPRCDLGVVLIDAGSTLTEDDVATIRTLYEAGIPASLLLSKCDLLSPEDRRRSLAYIAEQVRSQLGVAVSIHAASIHGSHTALLESWFSEVILPLYDRHQRLAHESLTRKIGWLRENLTAALRLRLHRAGGALGSGESAVDRDGSGLSELDSRLRLAVGRIAETREVCFQATLAIRGLADQALAEAAGRLTEAWYRRETGSSSSVVHAALADAAARQASVIAGALTDLARELAQALRTTAQALHLREALRDEDLISAIQEMPALDLGELVLDLQPGLPWKLARSLMLRHTRSVLRRQAGARVSEAFTQLGSMLDAWVRRTLSTQQNRFESHADAYRAHLGCMSARGGVSSQGAAAISHDLALLAEAPGEPKIEASPVS